MSYDNISWEIIFNLYTLGHLKWDKSHKKPKVLLFQAV